MPVWINEIHYDNSGTDADELVEIAGTAGTDLTGWSIVLYNGAVPTAGGNYSTSPLSGTISNQSNGFGTVSISTSGLQNGPNDGIALVDASGQVVQFLSYEGTMKAVDGPAKDLTSIDIGVSEDPAPAAGTSMQLRGTGDEYSDFTWAANVTATGGAVNSGQSFPEPEPTGPDATSTATAGAEAEALTLASTVTTAAEAVSVLDLTITDAGTADGTATLVSQVVVSTQGSTADPGKVTWLLSGADISGSVTGTYDPGANAITFANLNLSIADLTSETYAIKGYYSDNTGLIEGSTYKLSLDGDASFTVGADGSQMKAGQDAVTNGPGATVGVTATKLVFGTEPTGSVSGQALSGQPAVRATDAAGNLDKDFSGAVSLSESAPGTLSGTTILNATAGVATFTNVVYTATADQQAFTLDAAATGLTGTTSASVTSDVVATKLVFAAEPAPTTIISGQTSSFSTAPVVQAVDAGGVADTGYSGSVTLSLTDPLDGVIDAGTDGALTSLTGTGDSDGAATTVTLALTAGQATFSGLATRFTNKDASETLVLQAAATGLTAATSGALTSLVAPTVTSIVRTGAADELTNDGSVTYTVTFAETVTGVDPGDFALSTAADVAGASVTGVSGSGTTYTVTVGTGTGDGTIRLDLVDNDTIVNGSNVPLAGQGLGNGSYSAGPSYTIDKTAPTTAISAIALSDDTGTSGADLVTRTAAQTVTATLSAALAAGDEVLYGSADGGATWADITAKVTGTTITWSGVTLSGTSSLQFKVADAAGNDGPTKSETYTLDTTAPATTISGIDISADTGPSNTDFITNTAAQTVTATLSAGLADGEILYGSADGGATWSDITAKVAGTAVTWNGATLAGTSALKLKVTDAAGNDGASATRAYQLDTSTPSAPAGLDLAAEDDTGASTSDNLTQSASSLTISGTAETGATVTLFDDRDGDGIVDAGETLATTTVVESTFTADVSLSEGTHSLKAVQADRAGNASAASAALVVKVDAAAPTVTVTLADASLNDGDTTSAVTFTFSEVPTGFELSDVTATGGTLSNLQPDGTDPLVYTATLTVPQDSVTPVSIQVRAGTVTDSVGNLNIASDEGTAAVDTRNPTATVALSRTSFTPGQSAVVTFTFSEPPAGFTLDDVTAENGTLSNLIATADPTVFTATFTPASGVLDATNLIALSTRWTDRAGNAPAASASPAPYGLDTRIAAAPSAPDLVTASDTGTSGTDDITGDTTPTFAGSGAVAGAPVRLYANGALVGTGTADAAGLWSITTSELAPGRYAVTARQVDAGGSESPASAALPVTIGTLIDGLVVEPSTETSPNGQTVEVITIPVVTGARADQIATTPHADIPLVTAGGRVVLSVEVPTGFGLRVENAAGSSGADGLIQAIQNRTQSGSQEQQTFVQAGTAFLAHLDPSTVLTVRTLVPTVPGAVAPGEPLIVRGQAGPTGEQEALVIDVAGLPSGTVIQLENVEFAVIVGAVTVTGGSGPQVVFGDGAAQRIVLGAGDDELHGGGGDDVVGSLGGDDMLFGDAGNDTVSGGKGQDLLFGDAGDDTVTGGTGHDRLRGGDGDDLLVGGVGRDRMWGGSGADAFAFDTVRESTGRASDTIRGFESGLDRVDLSGIDADVARKGDQAFSWAGADGPFVRPAETRAFLEAGFTGEAGQLRYAGGVLTGDTDRDGRADFQIRIAGSFSFGDVFL